MSEPASVSIVGVGLRSSIGLDAWMSVGAVRGGLSRMREVAWVDRRGERVVAAPCSSVAELTGVERWWGLLGPAVNEALASAGLSAGEGPALGLWLCLPEGRPEGAELAARAQLLLAGVGRSGAANLRRGGHAEALIALQDAALALEEGRVEVAVLCGVDSLISAGLLDGHDRSGRLKTLHRTAGFIPGEAGAAVVLRRTGGGPTRVMSIGVAREGETILRPEAICIGQGLTAAVWAALAPLERSGGRADLTVCDLNGEDYRAAEWSFAYLRTGSFHGHPLDLWHAADCWGDLGAAAGLADLVLAALLLSERRGRALVWGSSDDGARGAVLLEGAAPMRRATMPALTEPERAFAMGVWLEHLDEAAFLLVQREALLEQPGATWTDPWRSEERLDAHLLALAGQGVDALPALLEVAVAGPELALVVTMLVRAGEIDRARAVLDAADRVPVDHLALLLRYFAPHRGSTLAGLLLGHASAELRSVALLAGDHLVLEEVIQQAEVAEPGVAALAARALGRTRDPRAAGTLSRLLGERLPPAVEAAVAEAGLLHGLSAARQRAQVVAAGPTPPWDAPLLLALAGDPGCLSFIVGEGPLVDPRRAEALGWLGDPAALSRLREAVESTDAALSTAAAAACARLGEVPSRGSVPGQRATRWRHGQAWTPSRAMAALQNGATPPGDRQRWMLELELRAGVRFSSDTRSPVKRQREALSEQLAHLAQRRDAEEEWGPP